MKSQIVRRSRSVVSIGALGVSLLYTVAHAQTGMGTPGSEFTGANASSLMGVDASEAAEIIVTATKRSERLQDVPISVSAIGGDALASSRVTRPDDLVTRVPNLQLSSTVGNGTPIFSLRGVSMSDFSLNQSGPVATYYDEVYKGNFAFLGLSMYDLERVEVLRGPQGTLYGKNTTGGAVNLISRRPEFSSVNGYLNLGYGNFDRKEASGAINLPLSDTLAARVAFTAAKADGWFKNRFPNGADLEDTREYAVRGSLRWQPQPGMDFILRLSTSLQNPHNYGVYSQPGPVGVGAGVYEVFGGESYFRPNDFGRLEGALNYTPRRRARTNSAALTANVDLGDGLSLASVTSWDDGTLNFGEDTSGAPNQTLEVFYGDSARQFAQDLRLSKSGGPFEFILGAYFNREKVFNTTRQLVFGDIDLDGSGSVDAADCAAGAPAYFLACNFVNSFDQLKKSYALYSDFSHRLDEGLTLRGGLRFTHDIGKQYNLVSNAFGVDDVLVTELIPSTTREFETNNLSGKFGLDYKFSRDVMLYASYSRGYRGNSFNAQAFFDVSEATVSKPEKLDAFELGAKTQIFDRALTLNVAAFYYKYANQQFINVDPTTLAQSLVNLDRSRLYGGEAELTGRISESFAVRGGLGILSSRVERGVLSGSDLAGKRLLNAPNITASAGLDLTLFDTVKAGKLSIHPDVSYVSSQYFDVFNKIELKQSGYELFSGRIDYEWRAFTASIWSKNLANRFYTTSRLDGIGGFGFLYNHVGAPRTYGLTVGYKF